MRPIKLLVILAVLLAVAVTQSLTVGAHAAPQITLTPEWGSPGVIVRVTGSGFSPTDTSCTISSSPRGLISKGRCAADLLPHGVQSSGRVSGSFTVASGASGAYAVVVTGSSGSSASATFLVQTSTVATTAVIGERSLTTTQATTRVTEMPRTTTFEAVTFTTTVWTHLAPSTSWAPFQMLLLAALSVCVVVASASYALGRRT